MVVPSPNQIEVFSDNSQYYIHTQCVHLCNVCNIIITQNKYCDLWISIPVAITCWIIDDFMLQEYFYIYRHDTKT